MFNRPFKQLQEKASGIIQKQARIEQQIFSSGLLHAKLERQKTTISELAEVEWKAFSQWGEDGIIDWLVHQIPDIPKTFVEFGIENYLESNTRMLLMARNWRGLIMDGSDDHIHHVTQQSIYWKYDVTAVSTFITAENINQLLDQHGFTGEIGILSIDIDGNDYWVWKAIQAANPAIVICEYNAVFGDLHAITIPYDSRFIRKKAHPSCIYYGTSIQALIELAKHNGYVFLGTNLNGSSGFFIRKDNFVHFENKIKKVTTYPSRFREARNDKGELIYLSGAHRQKLIGHLPVVNLRTEKTVRLDEMGSLYSQDWLP